MGNNRENMVKPDFMTDEQWAWFKDQTSSLDRIRSDAKADVQAYLDNPDGRASGAATGFPTLLLTCIGRKSGEKRTTPLVFIQDGDNYVVVGSLAGYDVNPNWYGNIVANPNCWVQLDRKKMTAVAREATPAERETLWPKLIAVFPAWAYFQGQTQRPFPVVILSPTGPA